VVGITAGSREVPGRKDRDNRHPYRTIIIVIIIIIIIIISEWNYFKVIQKIREQHTRKT